MELVFSDLDGTLLHSQTYSVTAAIPALRKLRNAGIPLVFCTSKTRGEVELWRERLGNRHPFIVENGGAIYIPAGYFSFEIPDAVDRGGYKVIEFGVPYKGLVDALRAASKRSGCETLGFKDMTAAEISRRTLLPLEQAELAKCREYDEPFEILCGVSHSLLDAIEEQGCRWRRGVQFYHVSGHADKCQAVERLTELYRHACAELTTVGIGDAHNDERFLNAVDRPIIVHSPFAPAIKRAVPKGRVTSAPGPYGWSEAVLGLMAKTLAAT